MVGHKYDYTIKAAIMKSINLILALLLSIVIPVSAQEADMSLIPYRQGDLWGYARPDKKIMIAPEFNEANLFYEGYASVKKGAKYGYINKSGKVVIPFKFYTAGSFCFGYIAKAKKIKTAYDLDDNQAVVLFAGASLRADGYEICINTKGETMPQCPAINDNTTRELNKPAIPMIVSNYSTIQKSELFDKITDDYKITGQEDTYYIAIRGNNYGVFNNKFDVVVPFEFTAIKKIEINNSVYLQVHKNEWKGLYTGNGLVSIPVENDSLQGIKANDGKYYFIVSINGKSGIKDADNNGLVPLIYTDIKYDEGGGFVLTTNDNLKGFCFLNTHLLKPGYADIKAVKGGEYVMIKTQTGKSGFINNKGDEFFVE